MNASEKIQAAIDKLEGLRSESTRGNWGAKLHPNFDAEIVNSDDYGHWTVADLIDILSDYPLDARVWVMDPNADDREVLTVWPIELISGHGDPGHVVLG